MQKLGKVVDLKLFTGKQERGRVIQNLRTVVDYRVTPSEVETASSAVNGVQTFQWNDWSYSDGETPYVDSEALRLAFFAVETPGEAESFLRACGPFRSDACSVTWDKFQEWQAYFKLQRRLGAAGTGWGSPPEYVLPEGEMTDGSVYDRITRVPKLEPIISSKGHLSLAARAFSAVECLAAANFLERLSNIVLLACRHCGDPFPPRTKASLFCKHGCAHAYWRTHGPTANRKGDKHAKAAK